jgi:REP element-mobilizing transposase RayT
MKFVPRKTLPHEVPEWVSAGSLFFITIHCEARDRAQLTIPATAELLLESVGHYHANQRWFARLFLLMPDHAHALLAFPRAEAMPDVIADWKRYTARHASIVWQRDFFDHRLRGDEQWELKADYIRHNPVRKGLVLRAEDWPWIFRA